jgi:hypothetical protein
MEDKKELKEKLVSSNTVEEMKEFNEENIDYEDENPFLNSTENNDGIYIKKIILEYIKSLNSLNGNEMKPKTMLTSNYIFQNNSMENIIKNNNFCSIFSFFN